MWQSYVAELEGGNLSFGVGNPGALNPQHERSSDIRYVTHVHPMDKQRLLTQVTVSGHNMQTSFPLLFE